MHRRGDGYTLISDILASDRSRMATIEQVARWGLQDCWIAGGFVRNPVWDALFPGDGAVYESDVDVLYFDRSSTLSEHDERLSAELSRTTDLKIEVKNQARMHIKNNDPPYSSTREALTRWTETCTSVGIRWGDPGLEIMAPHGVDDLVAGHIRPTSSQDWVLALVAKRVENKNWLGRWHGLTLDPLLLGRLSNYLASLEA
jgi:uncharacterized protein